MANFRKLYFSSRESCHLTFFRTLSFWRDVWSREYHVNFLNFNDLIDIFTKSVFLKYCPLKRCWTTSEWLTLAFCRFDWVNFMPSQCQFEKYKTRLRIYRNHLYCPLTIASAPDYFGINGLTVPYTETYRRDAQKKNESTRQNDIFCKTDVLTT